MKNSEVTNEIETLVAAAKTLTRQLQDVKKSEIINYFDTILDMLSKIEE